MTHILDDGAGQVLTADCGVLCGQKIRRSAITKAQFKSFWNAGTLRKDKMCKPCLKKILGTFNPSDDGDSE